ncbi:MAG: hypothetical protein ACK5NF_02010 [Bacilli bacterium]
MNRVRKSYSVAKTKNLARLDALIKNDEKSTILFVSKYGSIKQGFLSDYINEHIKNETLVVNFMYFSEIYSEKNDFNLEKHFKKYLKIHSTEVNNNLEDNFDGQEEILEEIKPRRIEGLILMIDGIIIMLLNYFILVNIDLSTVSKIFKGKEQLVTYVFYALGLLFVIFGIWLFFKKTKSIKEKNVNKSKNSTLDVSGVNNEHSFTQREEDKEKLYQTQSLDFRDILNNSEKKYEFDLSTCDKKYFILYGLDEYVHYVKTNSTDSKELIKQVSDFMIKVYSTFKEYSDRKLIFVWKDRVFINQDLTLLIFDEVFTLYGDFDEIELRNHTHSTFESYGFSISEEILEVVYEKISYLSDIDSIASEMNGISQFIDFDICVDKLAYIQFLKLFDKNKIEALKKYYAKSENVIDLKFFSLSKTEFELYYMGTPKIVNINEESVNIDEEYLEYADIMIDNEINHIEYKVKDDYVKLIEFIKSVPETDLYLFVNLDILEYLINTNEKDLCEKTIFSLLNTPNNIFSIKIKQLFNGLAKKTYNPNYSLIVETIIIIMLAVEMRKELQCMYEYPKVYIQSNRKVAIMMVRHIYKKIEMFEVFNKNVVLIRNLLSEAIRKK